MADEDKTEDATPKKLEDAREKGDVPQSRDFAAFIVFLGASLAIYFGANSWGEKLSRVFRSFFSLEKGLPEDEKEAMQFIASSIWDVVLISSPILIAVFIFGIAAYVGQFGFLLTTEKLEPKLDKINPLNGFKKIFSKETAVELVKSVMKIGVFSIILYFVLRGEIDRMTEIGAAPVALILEYMITMIWKVLLASLLFIGALGLLDLGFQRWSYSERMKMSMKEVRDEFKAREGDPHVKARIRQIQRETARARMMDKVPQADVVVANPTHVAVALKYVKGEMRAPVVVAKGAGFVALRIKELAINSGVPVLEKRELARFLFKNVEIGETIPESLYSAVAEVLAFVIKMKRKYKSLGGVPRSALLTREVNS
jgi:flagellar biosynthetic protein FlhB